ncbi:MAG: winged helix-turn-helix transcriptional regulator [Thermoplasmatota archaeon]
MRGVLTLGSIALLLAVVPLAHAQTGTAGPTVSPGLPVTVSQVQAAAGQAAGTAQNTISDSQPADTAPVSAPAVTPGDPSPTISVSPLFVGTSLLGLVGAATVWWFLGSRFSTPAEVLENGVREKIYAYLRARVGANLKQITDDLGLTTTNAIWHLRKLEDAGLIHSRRFNGYKIFYPAEGGIEARRLSLSLTALANDNARSVFQFVVTNPGTHQREIARALEVNHGTVRWHLKKLRRAEVLAEERLGKNSVYYPTETGLVALRNFEAQQSSPLPVMGPITTTRGAPSASVAAPAPPLATSAASTFGPTTL